MKSNIISNFQKNKRWTLQRSSKLKKKIAEIKELRLNNKKSVFRKPFSFWMSLSQLIFISVLSVPPTYAKAIDTQNTEKNDCHHALINLQKKNEELKSKLSAVNALLDSKENTDLSLLEIFGFDLKDQIAATKSINELSTQGTEQEVRELPEFTPFKKCLANPPFSRTLDDAILTQTLLSTKKLGFLKLKTSDRDALIMSFESNQQKRFDRQKIEKQRSDSQESLEEARANIGKENSSNLPTHNQQNDNVNSAKLNIEQFIVEIESEHIEFIDKIKKERELLDELKNRLNEHHQLDTKQEDLNEKFLSIDAIWRTAAESLLGTFTKIDISSQYTVPTLIEEQPTNDDERRLYSEYLKLDQQARQRLQELTNQKHSLLLDLKARNFRLVSDSGKLRANVINQCQTTNSCDNYGGFNEQSITGISTELRILPLKFLAGSLNKIVEFKAKINKGFDGWTDVARQIIIFVILILLPFLAHKALSWLSFRLNQFRVHILARSLIDYRRRTLIGVWISRINPFVPSLGMTASIHLARALIEATDLQEISYVLFYLEIYFIYRATRLLLIVIMELLFSSESLTLTHDLSRRAGDSATRLSRFFFGRFVLLHIIEDTVRRAMVYGIVYEVLTWVSLLVLLNEVRYWQVEILRSFEARYRTVWTRIKPFINGKSRYLAYPLMIILVIGYDTLKMVSLRLIKFDFFKRLISEVFRKKLEQDSDFSKPSKTPDSKYLSVFDYYLPANHEFYIDREPLMAKQILKSINNWLNDTSTEEDLVVLVGNRGIGKTTSAKMIFEGLESNDRYFLRTKPKTCSTEELFSWLSDVLKVRLHTIEDFIQMEAKLTQKMVLIVDDIHNLFVGKIGGFEAYKLFMDIISLKTKMIFWCLTTNSHSWSYLQGVFGHEHFYGQVYEMRMWTDAEIQNLILARHNITGYTRSFDKSISAYGTGNVLGEQVETQFFRLLWGQSRGNPRSALMYWISAISQTGGNEIHVGVPKFIVSGTVGNMSNDGLIILAALARHDSLTINELIEVTRVDKLTIRKVIKESTEKELIWKDQFDRIRISSRAQNAIDYYLLGKNFLYE